MGNFSAETIHTADPVFLHKTWAYDDPSLHIPQLASVAALYVRFHVLQRSALQTASHQRECVCVCGCVGLIFCMRAWVAFVLWCVGWFVF